MANDKQERSKNFKQSVDTKRMFIKSDSALSDHKATATTISSSDYNKFSASFAAGDHLLDDAVRENMGPFMYVIDTLQGDIEDIHSEVSTSMYESTVGTFLKYDTGSFNNVSSSLTPDADNTYDLGSSGNEWKNLYIDGVANVDELSLGVISTNLIPKTNAKKGSGQTIGSDKFRWSKIFVASHIDVSGSELIISSPSASVAGNDFNVIVSGSIVPGDTASGSIGTIDAPFKDLYVQSSSIFFADMSDHGGKSWKQMTKSERLSRTTTFHKDDIDKMKQGKSLNDSGDIKAEGNLEVDGESTLTGQTRIKGKTIIEGVTELSGSISTIGAMNVRGQFKVNGTQIEDLGESLAYSKALRDTGVTANEFDKLDGLTATTAELNKIDGFTGDKDDLNYAKDLKATGVTATEFDYLDGVTSNIQTQIDNAGGGSGGSGNYDTGSHLIPHAGATYDLGANKTQWKDLYVDGTAYIDSIAGGTFTQPLVKYRVTSAKAVTDNTIDARKFDIFEITANKDSTITGATANHPGQTITIVNAGSGAVKLKYSSKYANGGGLFYIGGADVNLKSNTAVQLICTTAGYWIKIV